jgi:CHAD domain-containing protein
MGNIYGRLIKMAIKSFKKYTEKRFENLNQLLSKPILKNSIGTFHQIRIEIKKLNAVSRFLEYSNIQFLHKKTRSKLEFIFSDSGNIRELQMGIQFINKSFPEMKTNEYVGVLKKRLLKYQANFNKKFSKDEEIENNSIPKDIKIDEIMLTNYIALLKKSKHQIVKGPKALPSMIHKIRVNLKDAAYLSKWLPSEKKIQKDIKFILELGVWHDLVSLRKLLLKTLVKKEFNELNTNQLILVIQKINRSIGFKLNQLNHVDENKKAKDKSIKKGQLN